MPTYLQQIFGKSYVRFETSWILCTLSNKFPRPGTVLPTGFPAKDNELQLKKTLRSCTFQSVPSLQCCEEWTDLVLLPTAVVICSYLNWSCSAYWTIRDLHAHYLWHVARQRQDEDTAATQSSQIPVTLTKLESSLISLVHENTNWYPTTPWWGHRHSSREDAKINNSLFCLSGCT